MCATVCPSQALFFGTKEEIERLRPMSAPVNRFQFGNQTISTRVFLMAPAQIARTQPLVDVTAAMSETPTPSRDLAESCRRSVSRTWRSDS